MTILANLVIAGLSIKEATQKSMQSIRSSLGNDVTLSVNIKNMMDHREKGQSMEMSETSITTQMADQLIGLEDVVSYNYTISQSVDSDDLTPVSLEQSDNSKEKAPLLNQSLGDFTLESNTTMENLEKFTSGSYSLVEGRLLTSEDNGSNYCVVETNLAKENDLAIGDLISVNRTVNNQQATQQLEIVGIYKIASGQEFSGPMDSNPVNKIYTPLSVGQSLSEDSSTLTSAIYYLNDPQNIDALKNSETFATMFLTVVIVAGSLILALVLILTMRQRFYEIGVFLSLGQSKFKIVLQHLLEIVVIACVGFSFSLTTGKMVSNFVGGMLEQGQSKSEVVMVKDGGKDEANSENEISKEDLFQGLNQMAKAPENQEYDVSLSGHTIMKLGGITLMICIISTLVPTVYILRLSPREILMRKEG